MQNTNSTVAVLMGGDSSERAVSFSSGRAVADALADAGYSVTCFDVSNQGYRGDISRADAMGRRPRHAIFPLAWDHLVTALYTNGFGAIFPVLHGGRGEDGTLQTLLEVGGLPYVGSPARACAIAIDKPLAKAYLRDFRRFARRAAVRLQRRGIGRFESKCPAPSNPRAAAVRSGLRSSSPVRPMICVAPSRAL